MTARKLSNGYLNISNDKNTNKNESSNNSNSNNKAIENSVGNDYKNNEELLRQKVLLLSLHSPCDLNSNKHQQQYTYEMHIGQWLQCVGSGCLEDAHTIMLHHIKNTIIQNDNSSNNNSSSDFLQYINISTLMSALQSIPPSVSASRIAVWLQSDVLPYLNRLLTQENDTTSDVPTLSPISHSGLLLSRIIENNKSSNTDNIDNDTETTASKTSPLSLFLQELVRRVYVSEDKNKNPFDAMKISELSVMIISSFVSPSISSSLPTTTMVNNTYPSSLSTTSTTSTSTTPATKDKSINDEIRQLLLNLNIQSYIWQHWGKTRPRLFFIEEYGLYGLIEQRLLTLSDEGERVVEDIHRVIAPTVERCSDGVGVDEILERFVIGMVEKRVVVIEEQRSGNDDDVDNNEESENDHINNNENNNEKKDSRKNIKENENESNNTTESTCSLVKLLNIIRTIKNINARVRTLLLLFQIPAVTQSDSNEVHTSISSNNNDNNQHNSKKLLYKNSIITQLCELSQSVCLLADPCISATLSLTEAIKLSRLSSMAQSYGVREFNPVNKTQIRAAAR